MITTRVVTKFSSEALMRAAIWWLLREPTYPTQCVFCLDWRSRDWMGSYVYVDDGWEWAEICPKCDREITLRLEEITDNGEGYDGTKEAVCPDPPGVDGSLGGIRETQKATGEERRAIIAQSVAGGVLPCMWRLIR